MNVLSRDKIQKCSKEEIVLNKIVQVPCDMIISEDSLGREIGVSESLTITSKSFEAIPGKLSEMYSSIMTYDSVYIYADSLAFFIGQSKNDSVLVYVEHTLDGYDNEDNTLYIDILSFYSVDDNEVLAIATARSLIADKVRGIRSREKGGKHLQATSDAKKVLQRVRTYP